MAFERVIGHARQMELLRRAVRNDALHHGLLVTGIPGVGKRTVARDLAWSLLCENPGSGESCRACEACRRMDREVHPDLVEVVPEGKFIKIEQIRDVRKTLLFPPVIGPHRVILILEAQRLNQDAGNALLKSLEEPPEGNFFVLTVPDERALLPTIVSRCRRIELNPLPERLIRQTLTQREGVPEDAASVIAAMSGGSLGRALESARTREKTDDSAAALGERIPAELQGLRESDIKIILSTAKRWSELPDEEERLLDIVRSRLRKLLLDTDVSSDKMNVSADEEVREVRSRESTLTAREIFSHLEAVQEASKAFRKNANKRLVWEILLLRLAGHG
jgi:DNA polymerase-3 subunit delta'